LLVGVDFGAPHFDAELNELAQLSLTAGLAPVPASPVTEKRRMPRCLSALAKPMKSRIHGAASWRF
jgi:hypothetical protein